MGFFGWTLAALGIVVLLGLLITSGDIRDRTAGTGERRISRRGQLAAQRNRIAELEQQIAACPTCTPSEPGFPTVEEIAASDRSDPAPTISAPAPVDNGCRDTPRANAETQPVDVRDLRAAMGEADTVTLPVVSPVVPVVAELDDTQMLVTWGRTRDTETAAVEAALNAPAPAPEYAATAVPPGIPDLAQGKVAAALATTTAD